MDRVVEESLAAINRQDWGGLRLNLHPYIHWTGASGDRWRGRTNVLAMLAATCPVLDIPTSYELRDGQIYRWKSAP